MVPFAIGGMVVWAVVGLVLLPFRDTLDAHGHGDWLAICLAGFLWGFPGLAVNRRRRRTAAETAAETSAGAAETEPGAPGPATVGPTTPA
jgi:hypothetical protein